MMSSPLRLPLLLLLSATLFGVLAPPAHVVTAQSAVLVPTGATWRYLDNGSNQGTAWRAVGFSDATWKSGPAQLGYGDGDEATIVGYGPNASAKYTTTYFRHTFQVADPTAFGSLTLRLLRDDGAVVYLNGTEVLRSNMPGGTIASTTFASTQIWGAPENQYVSSTVSPSRLVAGTNVIAVEVHQADRTSSDLGFDLQLAAGTGVQLTRGPYLQLGTPTSTIVKWRTGAATVGRVTYGLSPGAATWSVQETASKTDHKLTLPNLTPATRYYYSVGTPASVLAGGDSSYSFVTSPPVGTVRNTRIWVLGDSGTANAGARAVRDAYYAYTGTRRTDLWLMLGDNAYTNGTDADYQRAVFDMYPTMLRQTVLWPTLGNHDGYSADSQSLSGPYYSIFTLPRGAQAGGVPSGTEAYYSFDYANIHFVCLDSFDSNRSPGGAMLTWLRNDLAATRQTWIVAFFHHPPYSKGSHDSDTEAQLIDMRENALPILEDAGVDLVLSGHSHSYERSFLIDGHYGPSTTFTSSMKKNGGSGRIDGSGAYRKSSADPAPHEGAVYAVAGSSGQISGGALNHPAMYISLNSLGSLVLDVNGNRLDAAFIDSTRARRDYFTILKGSTGTVTQPAAPSGLVATPISAGWVRLDWIDNATNESGFQVQRSDDNVNFSTVATVGRNTTRYNNTGLQRTHTYYYRVRAFTNGSPAVYSAFSNTANATTPLPK